MTASITWDTIIASNRILTHYIKSPQMASQFPRLTLVNPHQWSMDNKLLLHSQIECNIQTFDKSIPTIRVTTEIRLRYSRHQMAYAMLASKKSGNTQKEKIASRNKCNGQ